jgi:hypothetical protein
MLSLRIWFIARFVKVKTEPVGSGILTSFPRFVIRRFINQDEEVARATQSVLERFSSIAVS